MKTLKKKIYNSITLGDKNQSITAVVINSILMFLISLNAIFLMISTVETVSQDVKKIIANFEFVSLIIFTIEYILRLWTSEFIFPKISTGRATIKYIFSFMALIDLISIVPFFLPMFFPSNLISLRLLRLFRLVRILKISRYSKSINSIAKVLKKQAAQLISSISVVMILIFISSIFMYYAEHEAQPKVFSNAFSGMWWSIVTVTTVGYGDIFPITILGKILSSIISLLGIGLVAVPTGIISAGFIEETSNEKQKEKKFCPHCGEKLN